MARAISGISREVEPNARMHLPVAQRGKTLAVLSTNSDEATRHLRTLRETVEAEEGPMFVLVIPRA